MCLWPKYCGLRTLGPFFSYKCMGNQIWPRLKLGKTQPMTIIYTNSIEFEPSMLHVKFEGHLTSGSEEEDFKCFTI